MEPMFAAAMFCGFIGGLLGGLLALVFASWYAVRRDLWRDTLPVWDERGVWR